MKTNEGRPHMYTIPDLRSIAISMLLSLSTQLVQGQAPVIHLFSRNGELVCTELEPGTIATVEWASSVTGPWKKSWSDLEAVMVDSSGTISVKVPMFYRVQGVPANLDPERLAWIPPGTFTMGSPVTEPERERLFLQYGLGNETQHEVTISSGFWMGRYEVTQDEYMEVVGSNPSLFSGANLPVENVSWNDSEHYCSELTERERIAGRLPEGYVYRLPTEAEWEYACRAGTTTAFHYGNELRSGMANFRGTAEYSVSEGGTVANPSGLALERTSPVGSYEPNPWGLYDMHGNVWERCYDWIDNYGSDPVIDPVVTSSGPHDGARVERGGSWRGQAGGRSCRSAHRNYHLPDYRGNGNYGFRVVLAPPIAESQ